MGTIKRTNPGDAANIFVRCMLSDISDILSGFSNEELEKTVEYFDYKCPYTGEDISVEYKSKKWVLDHLIPHNRESIGLNLYGNIIVTTKETNAKKSAKSFEDFIRYETKGTEEEKEKRIKKIRQFQQDAGYFEKVKNVDELKELCKKSYDEIQNKLKSFLKEYENILGVQNRTDAQVSSINKSFVRTSMQMPKFAGSSNGMTKPLAIQMAKKSGIEVLAREFDGENVTFKYITNEDFKNEILMPTLQRTSSDADTSELFLRSYKLLDMFDFCKPEQKIVYQTNPMQEQNFSEQILSQVVKTQAVQNIQHTQNNFSSSNYSLMSPPKIHFFVQDTEVQKYEFNRVLLQTKQAKRIWYFADGRTREEMWNANNFTENSDLMANIKTSATYRNWKEKGIVKVEFKI